MNNYEILGVRTDASEEDIRLAYNRRLKLIDKEIQSREKADLFKGILKNAYNELMCLQATSTSIGQVPEETIVMSVDEINNLLDNPYENEADYDDEYEDDYYDDDEYEDDDYYDDDYYEEEDTRKKQKAKKNKKKKSNIAKKGKAKKKKSKDREDKKDNKKYYDDDYDDEKSSSLWLLPLKILAFPIIVVLSIITFILDILSAIIWVVTKVLVVLAIVVGGFHAYQVYSGMEVLRYDVLAGCIGALAVGILLPLVSEFLFEPLKMLNSSLKDFVF